MGVCQAENEFATKKSLTLLYVSFAKKTSFRLYLQTIHTSPSPSTYSGMDTKWKIPNDGKPGDTDLQQMHAYNVQFGANRSFLLYPRVGTKVDVSGRFSQGEALPPSFDHNCGMVFLELFDGDKLRSDLGKDLVAMLVNST